ncbi:hypothetical protein [Idiomarina ramblicola]|uniref:Uncharacterized protein n=1 Tax=Idiomarina ramblicola TaxID=263724 RepID=A0A432YY79_9GAMM|nr:hypothetical protein [Idiomarina ramblicola]RUO68354.1 hypothetical protein CWI78_09040 [Idiomarina ramblicola]
MNKNNSAGRILRIIDKCRSGQTNRQQYLVWADVFGLDKEDNHSITSFLKLAFHELEVIQIEAEEQRIPSHLYKDTLARLEDLMNARNLSEAWSQKGNKITEGSLRDLAWLAFNLNEDSDVSGDDVKSLLSEINELEKLLDQQSFSPAQENFLKSQIGILKQGLKAFNVQGEKAVCDAVKKAVVDIPMSEDADEALRGDGKDSEPMNRYRKIMRRAATVSNTAFEAISKFNDTYRLADNLNLLGN